MEEGLLGGLKDSSTPEGRSQTLRYFEHLKELPEGWKICANTFTHRANSNSRVMFFCLQVVENHVRHRHASSSDDDILTLRKMLLGNGWIQPPEQDTGGMEVFIRNKMAQIYALTFVIDYPFKWRLFFSDLLQYVQLGHRWSVDLYLRILLAIDSEVVDRQVVHTQEENVRNTLIKDSLRDQYVPDLVESWLQIMDKFEKVDSPIVCQAMEVVGAFVSWIDITLIANDRFIGVLLKFISAPDLRESSVDCLHEIISKGMEPIEKTKLIESLYKVLMTLGVLSADYAKGDKEADFQVKLSKLINGMGCGLISSWNKLVKADDSYKDITLAAIENKLPFLHRYLIDEDDGVSEAIITFAVQYTGILKQRSNLSDNERSSLAALLDAVIRKLQYDEGYDFESEGEDEMMFIDYRKQLKVLFDSIAQVDPPLVLQNSQSWLSSVLSNLQSEPFMRVELVLRLFYMLREVVTNKQYGAVNVPNTVWHQMMCTILQSRVAFYPHTAVIQQFYEVIVRYEKFFSVETSFIAPVVETFLGVNGLRHSSMSLRSRLSYLLLRFIKSMKNVIGVFAEEILENLRELLLMLPGSSNYKVYLSTNDMNFLYEAAGILVVASAKTPEEKEALMNSVLNPVVELFPILMSQLLSVDEPKMQEDIGNALYGLISYVSRASKAFINHQQVLQNGCLECFSRPLPNFLSGLEVTVQRDVLHSGIRQYLHRMIICLGDDLLNYVPLAVSLLLKDCKAHDIQEFIPLINQLIVKYKERIYPILEKIFMPVCATIISCLSLPYDADDTEEQRDRHCLQKSYFLFISSVVGNNLSHVLSSQGLEKVQEVLNALIQNAIGFPDPAVQRICFSILKKLVDLWAEENVILGFVQYMYDHIIPACFIAPLKPDFDLDDGVSFMVLGEIAGILKSAFNKRGEEVILYIQRYLNSISVPLDITQDLILKLQSTDIKSLRSCLKAYFAELERTR